MVFIVSRTSDRPPEYDPTISDRKPSDLAKKEKILWNGLRYDKDGYLFDDEEIGEDWTVELNTLDDLLNLVKDCEQEIVIQKYRFNDCYYEIEIVDNYKD